MKVKIFFGIFVLCFLGLAHFVAAQNYEKHLQIRNEFVKHPEHLPKIEVAEKTTFGFSNVIADKFWLQTIQYIGGNAMDSAYKKYLYAILDIVTSLNPYFDNPYIVGMLLLPGHNDAYENLAEEAQKKHTQEAVKLGLKGIKNFCDIDKINKIDKEFDLKKIWNDPEYANPCKNDMIPFSLAFVYYYYMHEPLEAAKYYKVTSAIDGGLEGAKIMSAIMQGKGGEREKSIYMFLSMGRNIDSEDKQCAGLSLEIENIMNGLQAGKLGFSGEMIKAIGKTRTEVFGEFNDETKEKATSEASCQNFVNKAVREMNLLYLELANKKYMQENDGMTAKNGKELLKAGYIDYNPIDFQQYEDYGIVYEYNKSTGNFDYSNGGL